MDLALAPAEHREGARLAIVLEGRAFQDIVAALTYAPLRGWAGPTITFSLPRAGSAWDYPQHDAGWSEYYGNEPFKADYGVLSPAQADVFRQAVATWQQFIGVRLVETDDVAAPGQIRVDL